MSNQNAERIDSLFRIALVLLGFMAPVIFQFNQRFGSSEMLAALVSIRITALPFIVLIGFWIFKEFSKEWWGLNKVMVLTEFCWDLWVLTFFFYTLILANFYTQNQTIPVTTTALYLLPFVGIAILVNGTYRRIYGAEITYFKNPLGYLLSVLLFVIAFMLLVLIVFPYELFF